MGRPHVVVVGDALLDVDLAGQAGRLAPDAPVPVLDDLQETFRAGGAGLAAALAARADLQVTLVAGTADDADGDRLRALLAEAGVALVAVPRAGSTVVKRRVRASGQSLLRLDSGTPGPVRVTAEALAALGTADAVLVSDYGHGLVADPSLREALTERARAVPVVWDPHPRGSAPVPGVRLVTPNAGEAALLAPAPQVGAEDGAGHGAAGATGLAVADGQARRLVRLWQAHGVVVTLGGDGAMLVTGEPVPYLFPAPAVAVGDTCGAGDAFAAAATGALARGALLPEAVQDAVTTAAAFVARGGAAGDQPATTRPTGTAEEVRALGGTVVATGGCFDLLHAGHVHALQAARALGDHLVVCLNSDASVRRLKGPDRPVVPQADRVRVLEALGCVDEVVVFDEDTPEETLSRLRPDVWVKGADYAGVELPEAALLRSWGGQAVVVPYLAGRSTTSLVDGLAGSLASR